jgi:hypothetical protein
MSLLGAVSRYKDFKKQFYEQYHNRTWKVKQQYTGYGPALNTANGIKDNGLSYHANCLSANETI